MPSRTHILTVDVEEHFQVAAFDGLVRRRDWHRLPSRVTVGMEKLIGLLGEAGASATCFVLGIVAERNPELLRRWVDAGLEVASHGHAHEALWAMDEEAFAEDLRRAEEAIGAACGARVAGFRAPNFSVTRETLWAFDVLEARGYRYDSSVFPGLHWAYGMARAPSGPFTVACGGGGSILELPVAVARRFGVPLSAAGGAYLRFLPYRVLRVLLRSIEARSRLPFTVYCHPWELDPDQPNIPAPLLVRMRHYHGLRHTEGKLRALLRDFRFSGVSAAIDSGRLTSAAERRIPVRELGTPPRG